MLFGIILMSISIIILKGIFNRTHMNLDHSATKMVCLELVNGSLSNNVLGNRDSQDMRIRDFLRLVKDHSFMVDFGKLERNCSQLTSTIQFLLPGGSEYVSFQNDTLKETVGMTKKCGLKLGNTLGYKKLLET